MRVRYHAYRGLVGQSIINVLRSCLLIALCLLSFISIARAEQTVLFINSSHSGDQWSDGVLRGITDRILIEDVELISYDMDTLRHREPDFMSQAVNDAQNQIDQISPDVVIALDDNVAQFLVLPHFKNTSTPFVLCGLDWDASRYALPRSNIAGMVETDHIASIVDLLGNYAKGKKLGFLSYDADSQRRTVESYTKILNRSFAKAYYVNTLQQWQQKFTALQTEVDIMILGNPDVIENWNYAVAHEYVIQQALIPAGSTYTWLAPLSLITIAKIPEEQGWWAAEKAMQILKGKSPADIPVAQNREGKLVANLEIAKKLELTLSQELIEIATLIDN